MNAPVLEEGSVGTECKRRDIELLQILAEGCRKHPAYRARRTATGKCEGCVTVWKARMEYGLILMKTLNDSS